VPTTLALLAATAFLPLHPLVAMTATAVACGIIALAQRQKHTTAVHTHAACGQERLAAKHSVISVAMAQSTHVLTTRVVARS
jgi:hypothetical protein